MPYQTLSVIVIALFLFISCNDERQRPHEDYVFGNPAGNGSRFPSLSAEEDGSFYMSWLTRIEEEIFALEYASFSDGSWQNPQTVHVGNDFFVSWADFPSVATFAGDPVAFQWARKPETDSRDYSVQISFPGEELRHWNHVPLPASGTASEQGFVTMLPLGRDRVLVTWMEGNQLHNSDTDSDTDTGAEEETALHSAVIHADASIEHERVIDRAACNCGPADLVPVEGGAIAVYRGPAADGSRDISLGRFDAETGSWSEPETVFSGKGQGQAVGSPVHRPEAAAHGDNLAIAWHTEGEEDEGGLIRIVFSEDGGLSFSEPVVVSGGDADGRFDVTGAPDGSFYISWMERTRSFARIFLQKAEQSALTGDPVYIGSTDIGRNSGYPRLAALDDGIMVAWTQTTPFVQVRTGFYRYNMMDRSGENPGQANDPADPQPDGSEPVE
ncbi:MAG: hypothetical protein WD317_09070 [Balneolaceae bacterium]